ncbi:hypothetical protein QWJ34_13180 [Saccharibacillus sp. CPCC 101409]|uniref:hypothetical protein n=1 Tax=Saccharibacillus sp. CPCC 101409 TaxID=3058041 RepID=UPI002671EE6E|nr:hypothetical protein [Saccharibacillus sp. CPCC 101409]MDO3410718.1 hypothetical protein [Saccharibacillus sp. CPCC 101409]
MNIGSLLKGMMGEARPGEVKSLELREGQVVRGVVLSVSDDGKEGVIQVQGVKVNAKLEAPLQAGQTTFMQVQPAAEDGTMVMKPVAAPPGAEGGAQSIGDTLKQLGLPDNKQTRELVRMMQQAEIPLTREQAAEVRNLLAQKPAAVNAQEWVKSIGILQQRGLPVTPQSVAGLQQAVFGPPVSDLLQNLEQQVSAALANLGGEEGDVVPGRGTGMGGNAGMPAGTAGSGTAAGTASGANTPANGAGTAGTGGSAAGGAAVNAGGAGAAGNAAGSAAGAGAPGGAVNAGGANAGSANNGAGGVPVSGTPAGLSAASAAADAVDSGPFPPARTAAGAAASGAAAGAGGAAVPDAAAQAAGTARAAGAAPAAGGAGSPPGTAAAPQAAAGTPPAAAQAGEAAPRAADAALLRKVQSLLGELRAASAGGTADEAPASAAQASPQSAAADTAGPWVGRLLKMLGAEHEQQTARTTLLQSAPQGAAAQPAAQAGAGQTAGAQLPAAQPSAAASGAAVPDGISPTVRAAAEQALRALSGSGDGPDAAAAADARSGAAGQAPAAHTPAEIRESLKSLLLQLSSSDSLPSAVKEAAQQAVQQMTGQQLLLNTDRTAPFAQVTMFLPFVGQDGSQTASVQIESRRGPKGELDASNCRLWFDLDMKSLGRTVVDVQVVDRNVSLNFRNDEEWVRPLLESSQNEIASALNNAGYQLMALRTDVLPQRPSEAAETSAAGSYTPSVYRGVDVKI